MRNAPLHLCHWQRGNAAHFFSEIWFAPFGHSSPAHPGRPPPPAPDAPHSVCLHICARHLGASMHLTKVRHLDFLRLSVCTYVNVCTFDKSEAPRLPLFVCLQIWQAFMHLARVESLDFPYSLFYAYVSAARSDKSENPRLPHSVCLHICARRYM